MHLGYNCHLLKALMCGLSSLIFGGFVLVNTKKKLPRQIDKSSFNDVIILWAIIMSIPVNYGAIFIVNYDVLWKLFVTKQENQGSEIIVNIFHSVIAKHFGKFLSHQTNIWSPEKWSWLWIIFVHVIHKVTFSII